MTPGCPAGRWSAPCTPPEGMPGSEAGRWAVRPDDYLQAPHRLGPAERARRRQPGQGVRLPKGLPEGGMCVRHGLTADAARSGRCSEGPKGGACPRPDGLRPQEGVDLGDDDQADGRLVAPLTPALWPDRPPTPRDDPLQEVRDFNGGNCPPARSRGAAIRVLLEAGTHPSRAQAPTEVRSAAGGSSYRSGRRPNQWRSLGQKGGSAPRRTNASGSSPRAAATICTSRRSGRA